MTLPPDTRFEIRALAVWGQARYLSVTEALYNTKSLRVSTVSGKEAFCFFETWIPERGTNPGSLTFQTGSFNHCTRAPDLLRLDLQSVKLYRRVPSHCSNQKLYSANAMINTSRWEFIITPFASSILLCKGKRQYLLTFQVSRYCLLPLLSSIILDVMVDKTDLAEIILWQTT